MINVKVKDDPSQDLHSSRFTRLTISIYLARKNKTIRSRDC